VLSACQQLADPARAVSNLRYFKTGKGEYSHGVKFLGMTSANIHAVAKDFKLLATSGDCVAVAQSEYNDVRAVGLELLGHVYARHAKNKNPGDSSLRRGCYTAFCDLVTAKKVDNWNLVDSSTMPVIGRELFEFETSSKARMNILSAWVRDDLLWQRRVAVLATFSGIKMNIHGPALELCEALLEDDEDLMHKATGWMLREVGKRDETLLLSFLDEHVSEMPRTMLRYAIEKLPENTRQKYLLRDSTHKRKKQKVEKRN
jgi:3-methyladenine DNA glycosylase AlkD